MQESSTGSKAIAQPGSSGQEDDGGATEHMLVMALESLYKDASEQDVRLGLLRTTLQILQRHGDSRMTC